MNTSLNWLARQLTPLSPATMSTDFVSALR